MKGNFVDKHNLDELVNDSSGHSFFNYVYMCVYACEYNDMDIKKRVSDPWTWNCKRL